MNTNQKPTMDKLFPLDDAPGPYRFGPKQAKAVVDGALNAWLEERSSAAPRRRRAWLLAAAIFAVTGAAAALVYVGRPSQPVRPQGRRAAPSKSASAAPAPGPARGEPRMQSQTPAEIYSGVARPRAAQRQAEDLLQRANQMRQQGKWNEAEQTYRRVCTLYPNSMPAYVALVAAASVRLEHLNNPRGALALYNQALSSAPRGVLDIEARLGVAESWRRLGDGQREMQALQEMLQKHSSGPMVERARQRLEAISNKE